MNQEVELGSITKQDVSLEDIQNVDIVIDDSDDENACVICLEDLDDIQSIHFHCGHIFHIHCILEWIYSLFQKNADISCPICRSVECHSRSPYYNVLKVLVGYNEQRHSHVGEIQTRNQNNTVHMIPSHQIIYQDNQQVIDEGLRKGFFRFMMLFTIIMIGFLIYSVKNGR
jgi:hypothetical protein